MDSSPLYLAYLIGVDRNSATFALHTGWTGKSTNEFETRIASLLDPDKIPAVLEELEVAALVIQTWTDFYRWLGKGGRSWGAFTKETGERMMPHWLLPSMEYECKRTPDEVVAFFDRKCQVEPQSLRDLQIYGTSPEPGAMRRVAQLNSDLMVTTQPLFS